jgi:uncharacterized membrane protein
MHFGRVLAVATDIALEWSHAPRGVWLILAALFAAFLLAGARRRPTSRGPQSARLETGTNRRRWLWFTLVPAGLLWAAWGLSARADAGGLHALLLVLLLTAAAVMSYRASLIGPPRALRAWLSMLRGATVLALLMLLVRPTLSWTATRQESTRIAVVLDDSRSMLIKDVVEPGERGAPRSRVSALKEALQRTESIWRRLARDGRLAIYRFSHDAVHQEDWTLTTEGDATSLSAGLLAPLEHPPLDQRRDRQGAAPPAVVVLFSDGADNVTGPSVTLAAARRLAAGGTAIFAVGVGSEEPRGETRSIVAVDADVSPRAALDALISVQSTFECRGLADQPVKYQVFWGDEPVAERIATPTRIRSVEHIDFEIPAVSPGFHTVRICAEPLNVPWPAGPTCQSRFVHVYQEQIPVLYVESRPRQEAAFILRALAGEERFRVTRLLLARPVEGAWSNPLPRTAEQWQTYATVVLGDVSAAEMTHDRIVALRDAVSDFGAGLIVLGALRAMGPRGLWESPLADVLPVDASADDAQRVMRGPLPVILTRAGQQHPVTLAALGVPEADDRAGARLPDVPSAVRFGPPRPAAEVLATTTDDAPLIVAATVGRARVLAVAVDSTWHWSMAHDEGADLHRRFWRQALLSTANRRPQVFVAVDRPEYERMLLAAGRQRVVVEAYAIDTLTGRLIESAEPRLTMIAPDETRISVGLSRGETCWSAELRPKDEGTYQLELDVYEASTSHRAAALKRTILGQATTAFNVVSSDLETLDPLANLELLRKIASVTSGTGGRYFPLSQIEAMTAALDAHDRSRRIEERKSIDLFDALRWPVLLLICFLLSSEWMARKRHGLP